MRTFDEARETLIDAGFYVQAASADGPPWLQYTLHGKRRD